MPQEEWCSYTMSRIAQKKKEKSQGWLGPGRGPAITSSLVEKSCYLLTTDQMSIEVSWSSRPSTETSAPTGLVTNGISRLFR